MRAVEHADLEAADTQLSEGRPTAALQTANQDSAPAPARNHGGRAVTPLHQPAPPERYCVSGVSSPSCFILRTALQSTSSILTKETKAQNVSECYGQLAPECSPLTGGESTLPLARGRLRVACALQAQAW